MKLAQLYDNNWNKGMKAVVGSLLKEWRESNGFSQRTASAVLGISQAYYAHCERGDVRLSEKYLRAFMVVSGKSEDWIVDKIWNWEV